MRIVSYILLFSCFAFPAILLGQGKGGPPQIGLGWTGLLYTGDLTVNENEYLRIYPGGNIYLQFANSRKFRPRVNAGFGKVVEQWDGPVRLPETQQRVNTYFETNLFYIDLRLMRYFFINGKIQPYLGFGPSLFFFNPKDQEGNFLIDNIFTREVGEEFPTTTFVWPATVGLNIPFGKSLGVSADYTYRLNMSDYIDNIGLLGEDPGRDQIHAFQVSFNVNLGIQQPPSSPPPPPKEDPMILSLEETESPKGLSFGRKLKYRLIKGDHHKVSDKVNQMEIDYILYEEMPEPGTPSGPTVFSGPVQKHPSQEEDPTYWERMLKMALAQKAFTTIQTEGILSKASWAKVYHMSMETFERLNPGLPDVLPHSTTLTVPDWEAVARP